nr:microtubule-associated protein 4-like [Aegilops tauschii subsp. strangulata]
MEEEGSVRSQCRLQEGEQRRGTAGIVAAETSKGFPQSRATAPNPTQQPDPASQRPSVAWVGEARGALGGTTIRQIRSEDRGEVSGASSELAAGPPPTRLGRRPSASARATRHRATEIHPRVAAATSPSAARGSTATRPFTTTPDAGPAATPSHRVATPLTNAAPPPNATVPRRPTSRGEEKPCSRQS